MSSQTRIDGPSGPGPSMPGLGSFKMSSEVALGLAMVGILGIMLLPIPPIVLDLLLTASIALSLLVYLFSINIATPLEFSVFPSLLLMLTLGRLALNVASTRLILMRGGEGSGAAGHVVQAFSEFVTGGNTIIGVIVFLILVTINFVVITKGAGRISEVTARFTLDGMPGKQMAIDADLGAGLITEVQARERRARVEQEADFFGAMDGASKFVRGDAVAGLAITAINIVGGLVVGITQHGMEIGDAATTFTRLTVGDGLVSQVPALLTSIASGLVTTRAAAGGSLGSAVGKQIFGNRRPVIMTAGVLFTLALVPGMPTLAFSVLAGALAVLATKLKDAPSDGTPESSEESTAEQPQSERQQLETSLPLDVLQIEVGYELVAMVDANRDGSLLQRIARLRVQLAEDLGVLVPPIHMRDNLRLRPGAYTILLGGSPIGSGVVRADSLLLMNPAGEELGIAGEPTQEPAFGLPAVWISRQQREQAEIAGHTVVDPATVIATHLGELLSAHAGELIGRAEAQRLLDIHSAENSRVIEELLPNLLSMSQFVRILRALLSERVSIRDFRGILEALADSADEIKNVELLAEVVRQRLGRQIVNKHVGNDGKLPALILSPDTENTFRRLQATGQASVGAGEVQQLLQSFESSTKAVHLSADVPVVLAAADIRRAVAAFCTRHLGALSVLSYRELNPQVEVRTLAVVGGEARGMTA